MWSASARALLGFIAGAISVLIFHQGIIAALHASHVIPFGAYSTAPVPPFGVPRVADLAFWGGLYGLVFGLLLPRFTWPLWLCGIILGCIAGLVGMFVVFPLKGAPVAYGGHAPMIALNLLINGFWGLGVGLILPMLVPRRGRRPRSA